MQINKSNLQKALEIVKPGLANKEIIEQSTSFAFVNNKVVTYNDEISISHPIEGLDLQGAIKADKLYALLSKLKKEEITIEKTDSEITIQCGKSKASLLLEADIKLPIDSEISQIGKWKSLPEGFIESIKFCISACSRDMSKPILTCLNITKEGDVIGSDSFRIVKTTIPEMPVKTFLLPAASAVNLLKLNPVKIAEGKGGWIHFKTQEETIISCRILNDNYPDVSKYMEITGVESVLPKSIKDIIDRASVFSKRDFILDESLVCSISKNKFKVTSEADEGKYEEEVNIDYAGKNIEFIVSPYLLQGIIDRTLNYTISDSKLKFEGENWEAIICLKSK